MRLVSEVRIDYASKHLRSAALVASNGKEIAITEQMMQSAFDQYENSNFYPSNLMLQAKSFKKHNRSHLKLV
ncbi:MAG: hypothetical protein KUG76_04630 [Gammaproteobacteria bacterium]|nr:hypothetical protein [Gammaproteobacteria bacterium]